MSDSIQLANESLNRIDRKLFVLNIPIVISILITLGLSADAIKRMFEAFDAESAVQDSRNDASNFNRDLNSFSDSDNIAGFLIGLEDELSAVVTFEPKPSELRESMHVLFNDFNQNISDWDTNEIPNVDVFKIRISALTANLDAVSDENLMDVLRLVKDEIDRFRAETQAWANGLPQDDMRSVWALSQVLAGVALILGSMLAVAKRKNQLVQDRYMAMQVKVNAITTDVDSREVPKVLNSNEDIKTALLRVLLDMSARSEDEESAIAMRKYWLSRIIIAFYESPVESVGKTFNIIKAALNELLETLDVQYIYDYESKSEIRGDLSRVENIERRYKALQKLQEASAEPVAVEVVAAHTEDIHVEEKVEEEPTMLRVINASLPDVVNKLMKLNRKLVVDNSTLSFSQSISNSLEQFRSSVSTNDRNKATHYIKKMIAAIKKLKNENPKARDLFNGMEDDPIKQLESFLGSIGEV